jgi:hypothetical protein
MATVPILHNVSEVEKAPQYVLNTNLCITTSGRTPSQRSQCHAAQTNEGFGRWGVSGASGVEISPQIPTSPEIQLRPLKEKQEARERNRTMTIAKVKNTIVEY